MKMFRLTLPTVLSFVVFLSGAHCILQAMSNQPSECFDNWTETSTTNAPAGRYYHTAVWTGTEMIVWGGYATGFLNTGGRYNPSTSSWTAVSTTGAPSARYHHTAVWTGAEMIVWGGVGASGALNTGARYNPSTDTWSAISLTNAPSARAWHTSVWTGSEMILWGGDVDSNTGGRYNPATDSWVATSTTGAPSHRTNHTAIWTGNEMIIWGGYFFDGNSHYFNTGGRYDPATDTWTGTSTANTPTGRAEHTAVWTGSEMIVWGGGDINGAQDTGGRYDASIDSWTATTTINAPDSRYNHTAVWTGSEMVVWGGYVFDDFGHYLNTGGRYNPGADAWAATAANNAPAARDNHTAVWNDNEMIVWGGWNGVSYFSTGGTYCGQPGPPPTLAARVRRQGGNSIVVLTWTPANGGSVNVLRNGVTVNTTNDDGSAKDKLGTHTGTFYYQVCENDFGQCSNQVRVVVQ